MPLKETIQARKMTHAKQVSEGLTKWLCIRCNLEFPTEQFLTKNNGYRMKCASCSEKEAIANAKYRSQNARKVIEKSRIYEEKRKEKRGKVIEEHTRMVNEGCNVIICTRCKNGKPKSAFKKHNGGIARHCYQCRQRQAIIEEKRKPDTRVRSVRTKIKSVNHYACHKYCSYRRSDISKGFCENSEEFEKNLPRNYAYKLMNQPCCYCNTYENSKIGLDRVDPSRPHTIDNVLSCCETCNIGKSVLGLKQYIIHIRKEYKTTRNWISSSGSCECPF